MGSDLYLDRDYLHYMAMREVRAELKQREAQLSTIKELVRNLIAADKRGDNSEVKEIIKKLEERIK